MLTASSHHSSSTSEEDPVSVIDQKKRKRMLSNRESARRSRMRKQQHLDDLLKQVAELNKENSYILMQIDMLTQQQLCCDSQNTILRTQVLELTERLRSLNSVLHFMGEFSGMAMDIPEIPDPLLKPWQLTCADQPIMASADMFHC